MVTINEFENNIWADIFSPEDFPKNEFSRLIETLTKEATIACLFEFKNKQANKTETQNQNFKVISDGFISPNVLILSHIIVKTIFKIDEKTI